MVFNAYFNNISVISWWPVLLVEETGVPEKTIIDMFMILFYYFYRKVIYYVTMATILYTILQAINHIMYILISNELKAFLNKVLNSD